MTGQLSAVDLLDENFDSNDGGFVETSDGNTPIPSVYNALSGTWSMEGDDSGPATNWITSPVINVPNTAGLQVSFDHRYSIENDWDGTAIQIAVNGGEFVTVPRTSFSQNGYRDFALIGNHVLGGQNGFNQESPGYLNGDFITSIADLGGVAGGSTLQIRFLGAWDESVRGVGLPNWEIDSILIETLPDSDGDGMPDAYEAANGLQVNSDDSGGDLDSDNLSNLDEFLAGTYPDDSDSDDDGLLDGVETGTGIFVDANDTGTDPLNDDSDGDGLTDGVEDNSGTFVDASDPGTNPNLADTDDDGFNDLSEINAGGNPLDENSVPDVWVVRTATSSSPLNSIADTRALFEGNGVLNEVETSEVDINFRDNATGPFPNPRAFPVLGAQDVASDDYGLLATGSIFIDDPGIYTFGFNSDDGGGLYIDGRPAVIVDRNRGSQTTLGAINLAYGNHLVEFIYWERGGGAQVQLFAANEKGDRTGLPFNLAEYSLLEYSFREPVDSDNDDLDDGFEIAIFGDLSETGDGDFDNDGATNKEEADLGLDATDEDTDDDGLFDGVEDGGGVFVSDMETGTDPFLPDTDGDGLLDGVEDNGGAFVSATQTGTDPNNEDSDEDGFRDGLEVDEGSDPTDQNDVPEVPTATIIPTLLGGDLTDPENDGIEGPTVFGPPQTAGTNFNWVSITASEEEGFDSFAGSEGAFNVFDNQVGGGQAKWCCGGPAVNITVEFEEEVSLTHFTLTSSNDTPGRDPIEFQIQGSKDGVTFEDIYSRNEEQSLWTARNQTVRIDLPRPADPFKFIRYNVVRTGLNTVHALGEIEYFGEVGPVEPLKISEVVFDPDTERMTLTWNSREGKTYTLFTSTDLINFDEDLNDSIPSGGDVTTYEFVVPQPFDLKRFFRVVENP